MLVTLGSKESLEVDLFQQETQCFGTACANSACFWSVNWRRAPDESK